MLNSNLSQPPPIFWPSQPLNPSKFRPQMGQGSFLRTLQEKRKGGWVSKEAESPCCEVGDYLAKVATILEGDIAKTEAREEIMSSQAKMSQGRNDEQL